MSRFRSSYSRIKIFFSQFFRQTNRLFQGIIIIIIIIGARLKDTRMSLLSVFLLLILLFFTASAQESGVETERENSSGFKDLDCRSKIDFSFLGKDAGGYKIDVDSVDFGFNLDFGLGIFDAFFACFSMILVSEIGDEIFIIAALMAMRHPKSIVLSGALTALIVMIVLSTGLGRIVPNLISRKHPNSAATVLYAFFGLRLLYIAWRSDSKSSHKK